MADFYQPGQRQLQQEFQSTALADRLEKIIVQPRLDEAAQAFIAAQDHFYLSTVDAQGFPTVSYKGGAPGFVQVVDASTLRFPCFDGNGMCSPWATLPMWAKSACSSSTRCNPIVFAYRAMLDCYVTR